MGNPETKNTIGDRLLTLDSQSSDFKEHHRKEMSAMLENEKKNLKLAKRVNVFAYILMIVLSVTFLLAMSSHNFERKMEFGLMGIVFMVLASIFSIPMYVMQVRLEILKEVKELQLRIVELGEKIVTKK